MKRVEVAEIPPCQVHLANGSGVPCTQPGEYDVPTIHGPWANLCGSHRAAIQASGAATLGFHLVIPEPYPSDLDLHEDGN